MNCVLLCAGYATRLYPLTLNLPKPLLPVGGEPLLNYTVRKLKEVPQLKRIAIVTNDKFASQFEDWAKDAPIPDIQVVNDGSRNEDDRLGAIGDLNLVIREAGLADESLLVIAGDNIIMGSLAEFIETAESAGKIALGAVDVKDPILAKQYGILEIDSSGQVIQFHEKPENPPGTLASMGLYFFPKGKAGLIFKYLSEGGKKDQPGYFMEWLVQHESVKGARLDGLWYDIGDLKSYEKVKQGLN